MMLIAFLFLLGNQAEGFIQRHYRLQEVLDACSNIVFGKVISVDKKRMRAIVTVEENIKGKSPFKNIKINVAVGQHSGNLTSPRKMMKHFKVGLPAIVFYTANGMHQNVYDALGYVDGTWFQVMGQRNRPPDRTWWNFTHIEIHMHRTYKGTTEDFQKLLARTLRPFEYGEQGAVKVLMLSGRRSAKEFEALCKLKTIANRPAVYKSTQDRTFPDLDKADILWLGYREVSRVKYPFPSETDSKIRRFVKNGGIVILSGQDTDPQRPCSTGFLPEPIEGVELEKNTSFSPTKSVEELFQKPNLIQPNQVCIEDAWGNPSDRYVILARTVDMKNVAIAMLKYGKGLYLVTSMMNGPKNIAANVPLMQNLMDFAVRSL